MKRIDERTVELTDAERHASDQMDRVLDKGFGIQDAAMRVLRAVPSDIRTPEFVEYLSDGTVAVRSGILLRVRKAEQ